MSEHRFIRHVIATIAVAAAVSALRAQETTKDETAKDEVIKMEAFNVSTDLGNYAEPTSTAALKIPIALVDLPSTVQVLNSSFITDLKANTLNDVYSYVTGMTRSSVAQNDFTLRGFTFNGGTPQTLNGVEVDGLPGVTSRFGSPTTANIERVEVLNGPSTLLYGRIQPGGMINIETKRPERVTEASFFGTISTYDGDTSRLGKQLSYAGTLDFTGPIDNGGHFLYRMIANWEDDNSFRVPVWNVNYHLFPSFTYRLDENTSVTVEVEIAREVFQYDAGLAAPFNNIYDAAPINIVYQKPSDIEHDAGDSLTILAQHTFDKIWVTHLSARSTWEEDHRIELDTSTSTVTSVLPVQNSSIVRTLQHVANGHRFNFIDANTTGEFGPEIFRNTLIVGIGGGVGFFETNRFGFGNKVPAINIYNPVVDYPYPPDGTSLSNTKSTYNNYDAYASDMIKLGKHVRVLVGGRYDRQQGRNVNVLTKGLLTVQSGYKVDPEWALLYDTNANISIYTSYSQSYVPNSLTAYDANNNTNWPPMTASQVEFGAKGDYLNHRLTFTGAAYEIRLNNVLETTTNINPEGNVISILSGLQEVRGLELQSSWLPLPYWQFQLGFSYMPTAMTVRSITPYLVGLRLANDPVHSGSFWSRYNVPSGTFRGFGLGMGVIYQGQRDAGTTAAAAIQTAGYTRVDAGVYYHWKRTDFALNVANLLDRVYIAELTNNVSLYPGDPRKLTFSVKTKF